MDYYLDNPTSPTSYQFSNNIISSNKGRDFVLYRVNNDLVLNAASSTCPTQGSLPSTNTAVSIAGNGSELGSYVHSGMNGWGEWSMKYSSASTPVEHSVPGVGPIDYGTNHECRIVGTDV